MSKATDDDETRSVELPAGGHSTVENALKIRMADVLPMAATEDDGSDHWEREYGSLARSLRSVIEAADHERRVRVLDYPTDGGRLWKDLDVDPGTNDTYGTIAYSGGSP
jgi:hypothetical protein